MCKTGALGNRTLAAIYCSKARMHWSRTLFSVSYRIGGSMSSWGGVSWHQTLSSSSHISLWEERS